MISYRAAGHGEAVLGCLMLFGWGSCPSLCPLKTTAGGRRVKLLLTNVLTASVSFKPQKTKPIRAYRVAELRLVWFLSAVVFWVHIEVAPAWLNASQGASRSRPVHDSPASPLRCLRRAASRCRVVHQSICPSILCLWPAELLYVLSLKGLFNQITKMHISLFLVLSVQ